MRSLLIASALVLVAIGGWYFTWKSMMADDVARVQATIKHHYDTIKAATPTATFKADGVAAAGFPFKFRVAVHRPTLSQVWGGESYAVSFEQIALEPVGEHSYRIIAPAQFDALYAKDGSAPERYRVSVNEMPELRLEAKGEGALTHYAARLPKRLVLDVSLNGQTRQIGFDFPLPLPIAADIPANVSHPLQIFVGMLREAMVFQK